MASETPSPRYILPLSFFTELITRAILGAIFSPVEKIITGSYWIYLYPLGFVFFYGSIYVFFKTKSGKRYYSWWRDFKLVFLTAWFWQNRTPIIFPPDARSGEKLKERIDRNIKTSRKIYFSLLSAHTMFYSDQETFIAEAIKSLSGTELENKDIKFLLLDRNQPSFKKRGEWFIQEMNLKRYAYRLRNYEEYLRCCNDIEKEIRKISPNTELKFYSRFPTWRMFIFDDELFVSIYQHQIEGHLSTVYVFKRVSDDPKNSLYWGFYAYFMSAYMRWTKDTI